jgi:hypothetical protein
MSIPTPVPVPTPVIAPPKHPHPFGVKPLLSLKEGFSHRSLLVYNLPEGDGGNLIEKIHTPQGFAYRPGSATFFLIQDCLDMALNIYLLNKMPPVDKLCEQAIDIPFTIYPRQKIFNAPNKLIISSIFGEEHDITSHILPNRYTLRFEQGKDSEDKETGMAHLWGRLIWVPTANPVAKIQKAGREIHRPIPQKLVLTSGKN